MLFTLQLAHRLLQALALHLIEGVELVLLPPAAVQEFRGYLGALGDLRQRGGESLVDLVAGCSPPLSDALRAPRIELEKERRLPVLLDPAVHDVRLLGAQLGFGLYDEG